MAIKIPVHKLGKMPRDIISWLPHSTNEPSLDSGTIAGIIPIMHPIRNANDTPIN
mgnify:CR=1 FL=1